VHGLAFQQQDVGVSACATTALWSSLHKVRDYEEIPAATPAQITRLASQYTLPFGRPMPSEGLSIDQMCQAVQALGVSPKLLRANSYETARGYIYSAAISGFAPVLILEKGPSTNRQYHAVVVPGIEVRAVHEQSSITDQAGFVDDQAGDLLAVYVHDDRHGPYLRAKLIENGGQLEIEFPRIRDVQEDTERWRVTHLLIPMHSKIRLTFGTLRKLALSIVYCVSGFFRSVIKLTAGDIEPSIVFETLIYRANKYIESLFLGENTIEPENLQRFFRDVTLARYVGIVRVSASYIGCFDILVDTTSTPRNPHFLAVVARGPRTEHTARIAEQILSKECECLFFV
jgi:hypothetical protein